MSYFIRKTCIFTFITLMLLLKSSYSYKVNFVPYGKMAQKALLVYYSLRETLNTFDTPKVLVEFVERIHHSGMSRVQELLHAFHHDCQLTAHEERWLEHLERSDVRRKPLIVVEGTDRDTRRVVAKKLAYNMRALVMGSPPSCLNPMREHFSENLVLRRAYFSLCMYAGAINVTRHWYNHTIVMYGYWHDQATFSIAKKYSLRNMPPPESPIFDWPEDLIPPDVEFFINTPQSRLEHNTHVADTFKPRLVEAYRRMRNPTVFEISGNMYHDQIRFEMEIYLQKLYRENYKYIVNTV